MTLRPAAPGALDDLVVGRERRRRHRTAGRPWRRRRCRAGATARPSACRSCRRCRGCTGRRARGRRATPRPTTSPAAARSRPRRRAGPRPSRRPPGPARRAAGRSGRTSARVGAKRRVVDDAAGVGVVQEVAQLVGDVAVVDVERRRPGPGTRRASPRGTRCRCTGRAPRWSWPDSWPASCGPLAAGRRARGRAARWPAGGSARRRRRR